MKEIRGYLEALDEEKYVLRDMEGKLVELKRTEAYKESQAKVMKRAVEAMEQGEITQQGLDLVGGDKRLSAAQMDEVLSGLKDGLHPQAIALYANASIPTWQMDNYRFGMANGLLFYDIKEILDNNVSKTLELEDTAWEDSRREVNRKICHSRSQIVNDLKRNGISPQKHLVTKIEKLRGQLGRTYTVREVLDALKGEGPGNPDAAKKIRELGRELQRNQVRLGKQLMNVQAPVR